jgi:hypothetical protein
MTEIMSYLRVIRKRLFFTTCAFQNIEFPDHGLTRFRLSISCLFDENTAVIAEGGLTFFYTDSDVIMSYHITGMDVILVE